MIHPCAIHFREIPGKYPYEIMISRRASVPREAHKAQTLMNNAVFFHMFNMMNAVDYIREQAPSGREQLDAWVALQFACQEDAVLFRMTFDTTLLDETTF